MMKFTDLNFDCLEIVLEYLDLIDLLNVAEATKRLNKAAELVFAAKHGNKLVTFGDIMNNSRERFFEITCESIVINDLKTSLQLLRCVGRAVSAIQIGQPLTTYIIDQTILDKNIITYINNYCADYLRELTIYSRESVRSDLLEYFDKPFPKLTHFGTNGSKFTEKNHLNKLFPNIQCLWFWFKDDVTFFHTNTNHFPHLNEFSIQESSWSKSYLYNEMVLALLQLNPQLKALEIGVYQFTLNLNIDLIRNAVDSLQNIEILKICLKYSGESNNIIHMKSVKSFEIAFVQRGLDSEIYDDSSNILFPFAFDQLEHFTIYIPTMSSYGSFNEQIYDFVKKHQSIKHIVFIKRSGPLNMDLDRMGRSSPLLVDITVYDHSLPDKYIMNTQKYIRIP